MSSVPGGPPPALASASGTSGTSFNPFKALAKVAEKIADGVSSIFKRMGSQPASLGSQYSAHHPDDAGPGPAPPPSNKDVAPPPFGPQYGVRFQDKAEQGTTLNGYRVLGDKAKGVEPGFTALKDWHTDDDANLRQPGNALHGAAKQWVTQQMLTGIGPHRPALVQTVKAAVDMLALQGGGDTARAGLLKGMQDPQKGMLNFNMCTDKQLMDDIAEQALALLVENDSPVETAHVYDTLKQHLMETQPKFTEKHYIKLDYYEANKSISGNYTIPYAKTKALGGIPVLGNLLHKLGKSTSPREINQGAVNEKLANDLMGVLGMKTQTLDLVKSTYADGTPKVLLDSTHIQGFSDFDGEKNAAKGSVYIKDGVLVKNSRLPTDAPGEFNGPPQLHTGIDDLGGKKVMMLLLADRDALGSKGGNKGFVENQFFAIDPGHALEEKLLSKRGDVKSDLSFDPASSLASKDYKNFSIFDQSTFAEKMEGVRQLQQLKGRDSALFDEYAKAYGPEQGSDALNFRSQILDTQAQYIGRRDDILKTFSSRLAVDNYQFGAQVDSDPALKRNYRDQTLNLLDGLEKLTSTTVGTAKGKKDGIRLNIPHVQKPEDRKAWDVHQNGDNVVFTFNGEPAEARKMFETLNDFRDKTTGQPLPAFTTDGAGAITLSVPKSQILQAQSALSYSQIMQYKHG